MSYALSFDLMQGVICSACLLWFLIGGQ